jgi:hypothetical protein
MEKQATNRTRSEQNKGGLVITNAVYNIEGGDSLDVTVPLQFWVSLSKLELPLRKKGNLLGFYNLSDSVVVAAKANSGNNTERVGNGNDNHNDEEKKKTTPTTAASVWSFVVNLLSTTTRDDIGRQGDSEQHDAATAVVPQLTVWYNLGGHSYQISVADTDVLMLPNMNAAQL